MMMAAVEEGSRKDFSGISTRVGVKNVAKKSTTKPAQYLTQLSNSSADSMSSSVDSVAGGIDVSERLKAGINGQSKHILEAVSSSGLEPPASPPVVNGNNSGGGAGKRPADSTNDLTEEDNPAKIARMQIEQLEKHQEDMMQTIKSRDSAIRTPQVPASSTTDNNDSLDSNNKEQGTRSSYSEESSSAPFPDGDESRGSESRGSESGNLSDSCSLSSSLLGKSKKLNRLAIADKVKDSFKGLIKNVVHKIQTDSTTPKCTSTSPRGTGLSVSSSSSLSSSPNPSAEVSSFTKIGLNKGNLFENMSNLTEPKTANSACHENNDTRVDLTAAKELSSTNSLDLTESKEKGNVDLTLNDEENVDLTGTSEDNIDLTSTNGDENVDLTVAEDDVVKKDKSIDLTNSEANESESKQSKSDSAAELTEGEKDADALIMLDDDDDEVDDLGDVDDSILDKSDDNDGPEDGEDKNETASQKSKSTEKDLESKSDVVVSDSESHISNDTATVAKSEDNNKNADIIDSDGNVEEKEAGSDHGPTESTKEEKDDCVDSASKKRALSGEFDSDSDAKKSRLEKTGLDKLIGQLGSAIGIKPEEVTMEDDSSSDKESEDSEGSKDESTSTSADEDEDKSTKLLTLTPKELEGLIVKRMEEFLKSNHGSLVVQMQKKIEELQTSIECWRTQAKEIQKQMAEVSSKQSQRQERRRNPPRVPTRNMSIQVDEAKVQAAMVQQGLSPKGHGKTPPRGISAAAATPGTVAVPNSNIVAKPASTATGMMLVTASSAVPALSTPITTTKSGKLPTGMTVRNLLDAQRDVGIVSTTKTQSIALPGGGTAQVVPRTVVSNVRQGNSVATVVGRTPPLLVRGIIDLTDDDDPTSPPKTAGAVGTLVRAVGSTGTPTMTVRQAATAGGQVRSGTLLLQHNSNSGPMLVQQVGSQPMRTQQVTIMDASATRPTRTVMVQAPGTNSIVRGTLVATSTPAGLRPGQQLVVRQAVPITNRPPPPLHGAPAGSARHPAPLPPAPMNPATGKSTKLSPPKPGLKISRVQQGIVLSWNMTLNDTFDDISNYQLFAYQEGSAAPNTSLWKKVGDVKALPLPMACTLTQFQEGNKYHFSVRAVDTRGRIGPFSDPSSIHLLAAAT